MAGARNLGFHVAQTPWVLMADIDHVMTPEALERVTRLDLTDPNVVYSFSRRRIDGVYGGEAIINALLNRQRFFEIGGFDEDFSGHYGSEETFFEHCLKQHGLRHVRCQDIVLEWHPFSGATSRLRRDRQFNRELFNKKMGLLHQGQYKNGRLLRFSWSRCEGTTRPAATRPAPIQIPISSRFRSVRTF
jgi:hypothetical protein